MMKRTVIITGATKGIGEAIAKKFHDEGWYVIVGARNESGIVDKLKERIIFQKIDVSHRDEHFALIKKAQEWTGRLDAYINCAGFSKWSAIGDIDESFVDEMLDINLKGTIWGCQAAAASLTNGGAIVNISSLAGKRGSANNSIYCASKFGVNGVTQSLAKELGPIGVRVNAVCPVYVKTEGVLQALDDNSAPAQGDNVDKYLDQFEQSSTALHRLPTALEVANVCYFLASEEASAITGQCVNVDCGVLPQ